MTEQVRSQFHSSAVVMKCYTMKVSNGAFSVKTTDEKYFSAQCVFPDAKVLQVGYMDVRSHHRRRKIRSGNLSNHLRPNSDKHFCFLCRTEQAETVISVALL